ncbi:MAG: hypothetical protein V4580_16255 [Bacteroidota bacterium]
MKKRAHILFSVFLLISFSWQCAARTVIYFHFKFNQKELAATVCENKNKPKSCCEAKCYLEKEIKKEDKRQSDSSSSIKDKTEKSELRTGLITFIFEPSQESKQVFSTSTENIPNNISASVFHPPSF